MVSSFVGDAFRQGYCTETSRLGADDLAWLLGSDELVQDELRDLSGLATACFPAKYNYLVLKDVL